jgi:integrase
MGTVRWREGKEGRNERLVIRWYDAAGVQRDETIPTKGLDGQPLARRTAERDARRRLAEHELEVSRQRAGLAPISSDVLQRPFSSLVDFWWDHRGKALKSPSIRAFVEKHAAALLPLALRALTPVRLEKLIHTDLAGELAPKSRKHLRAYLFNVFQVARTRGGPWEGRANPVEEVKPVKVPKVPRAILKPEEMPAVLEQLEREWRGPVATALYAGLREGEIFGLRKEDVDLDTELLMVSRSWDAPRTKDGKALPVPFPPPLRPYIVEALRSAGGFLFPGEKGNMQPSDLRLGKVLRRAIAAAGLVVGYEHRCRAWRCGWRDRQATAEIPPACPKCGRPTTWAKPIPRHVRFHDTRHSYGTALVRSAGLKAAQQGLRHSDIRLTADTYGHLDVEDLRRGVLATFPAAPAPGGSGRPALSVVPPADEPEQGRHEGTDAEEGGKKKAAAPKPPRKPRP